MTKRIENKIDRLMEREVNLEINNSNGKNDKKIERIHKEIKKLGY